MKGIIEAAFGRSRTVILGFVLILLMGAVSYLNIPKESEPDVTIPTIYVSVTHEGISPEDAERLIIRPLERELQSIEGIEEMRSVAGEGYAAVTLEFDAGFDPDQALQDVRERVDIAKSDLPPDSDEPRINEVNVSLFPVLTVALSGQVPERTLVRIARRLQDDIEAIPGVLEAPIGGDREEVLEIVVDPTVMQTYGISYSDLSTLVARNNRLVAAGAIDTGAGRIRLEVPGVIENIEDVLSIPVKVSGNEVVTFRDVATIRRTFKDPDGFARVGGQPAVTLEVSKRAGANIIETIEAARAVIERSRESWPAGIEVTYMQDKSERIEEMLGDLENNVLTAVVLVMIVVVAALGLRPSILVGFAIPGSFLAGILVIYAMGLTMNIVVLFSLILVVGMLVDGAIVTTELGERKLAEGMDSREAFAFGAKRMAWPIIASTATTLAVFLPLLFWPGVVGEFMSFLPLTVIVTLAASLAMALVFIPVLGGLISKGKEGRGSNIANLQAAETGDLKDITGAAGRYLGMLRWLLRRPGKAFGVAVLLLIGTYIAYGLLGRGIEFFPSVEPDLAQVQVQARGDLSIHEKDALVRRVEQRLLAYEEFESVYARTVGDAQQQTQADMPEDVIGVIQLEFVNWRHRPPAAEIMERVRRDVADIPGILIQVREQQGGPSSGKPVQLRVTAANNADLAPGVARVRALMRQIGGFVDVEDGRPLPGLQWQLIVDRERAARYGADVALLGEAVKMVTTGILLAEYRPDDVDEELDIRVRFPFGERNLDQLNRLRVPTAQGQVPISNFVTFRPAPQTGTLDRIDGQRVMTIAADVAEGMLVADRVNALRAALEGAELPDGVRVSFAGEDEDQREASAFLSNAFGIAILLMFGILVTQLNSFYQAAVVLSAIIFSTAGVLLGLLITGQAFGLVMVGIGIIALAGIVVNNNIVLIDTFNELKGKGLAVEEAILRTAVQRLRPVLLTSITTVLGLMPMVLALNIDLVGRDATVGAPSSQWWTQLASAIAGGLTFATVLTLVLTPCLLMIGERVSARLRGRPLGRKKGSTEGRA